MSQVHAVSAWGIPRDGPHGDLGDPRFESRAAVRVGKFLNHPRRNPAGG